jgi:hypothetical protein
MPLRNLQGIGQHVSTRDERIGTLLAFDRDGRFLGAFSNDRRIAIPAVLPSVHAKDCCFSTTAAKSLIARTVEYSPNWETMMRPEKSKQREFEHVAGNGLLHRRALLRRGAAFAGSLATAVGLRGTGAAAEPRSMVSHFSYLRRTGGYAHD